MEIEILYDDSEVLVAIKPPAVPSEPDKTGDDDILTELKKTYKEIFLINRLDRPVSGVMLFAKNKKSAEYLSKSMQKNHINKEYMAVCNGKFKEEKGELTNYLLKNQRLNVSQIVDKNTKGAKEAKLTYEVLGYKNTEEYGEISLVKVCLITGRHHQIRVQLSGNGTPIFGDTKYNKNFNVRRKFINIALFSCSISFRHPKTQKDITITAKPKTDIFNMFCF